MSPKKIMLKGSEPLINAYCSKYQLPKSQLVSKMYVMEIK